MDQQISRAVRCATGLFAAFASAGAAHAAGATITVTNDLASPRAREVISVPFADIAALMPEARMYHLVVLDAKGRVVRSQITSYQHAHRGVHYDDLVFSHDFAAGEKRAVFTLENRAVAAPPDPACVYARFVPERFDDMAWENDRIAHRMYGAALNSPVAGFERLRGSGIDVWAKRVTYPIVDRWYAKGHDQLHRDEEGEGLDLYSIGGARGAGGSGVWDGAKLWTSDNFARAQVLANGPQRAAFNLTYAMWEAGSAGPVSESKKFTIDCGTNFDAVEDAYDFPVDHATIAIGLTEHKITAGFPGAAIARDPDNRWMSLWEEGKDGGVGVAIVLARDAPPATYAKDGPNDNGVANHLLLVQADDNVPLRYFTGAGWNRSGQFKDRGAWEAYVQDFAMRVAHPLAVTLSAQP